MIYYNNEAIFNVIGDYPVVDQFDVLYSNLMSGSTYDNYLTGSLLTATRTTDGRVTYSSGERGLVFSRLGVRRDSFPNPNADGAKYTDDINQSYNLQPWRERAGIIRNVRMFSSAERFYDSMAPGVSQVLKELGGDGIVNISSNYTLYFGRSSAGNGNDGSLFSSYPFQPTLSRLKRVKRLATSFIANDGSIAPGFYIFYHLLAANGISPDDAYWTPSETIGGLLKESDIVKLTLGIGDQILHFSGSSPYSTFYSKQLPKERYAIGDKLLSPILRGWKYGLFDGNPHYSSAIFRRDRFGQLRDMLEQRPNAAYVDDEENSPFRYLGSFETPALPPTDPSAASLSERQRGISNALSALQGENLSATPVVKVNFTRQTYIESSRELVYFPEKPENTWSSNLSQYATSSLPYFDDVPRNRPGLTFTPSSVVLSSLADVFGNQIIGG